jgi:hypothetical protein
MWHKNTGWKQLENVDAGLSNGVEVTIDGRWMFIADTKKHTVIRMPVHGNAESKVIALNFLPDNLRWGEDGGLYVTGPEFPRDESDQQARAACYQLQVCILGFAIARIDPIQLTSEEVFRSGSDGIDGVFGTATTALQIDKQFWVGTSRGDRIAILSRTESIALSH